MPLGQIRVADEAFPAEPMPCLRCGAEVSMRFAGPCPACAAELRANMRGERKEVDTAYDPKMNVTVNAVALKDD
jgi:hypothetical protein